MSSRPTAAVVTGAAQGIGRAIAERFAADDDHDVVALVDVQESVEDVAADLDGGRGYVGDVADQERLREVVEDVEREADVTTAVNNAGFSRYAWIGDLEPDEWDELVDVNLKGQYNLARVVAPRMYERGEGALVNISSGAGTRGSVSGGVHYSASKAGVLGLTKGLAKQLAPRVRVNAVVPGLIDTPAGGSGDDSGGLWTEEGLDRMRRLVPLQRRGRPEELAAAVAFLASDEASYVTGTTLSVDGGSALMPTKEFLMPESEGEDGADDDAGRTDGGPLDLGDVE
jgi:3-oxoacyl-[acyl-carrier protein] reductase